MEEIPENRAGDTNGKKKRVRLNQSIAAKFRIAELVAINATDPEILTFTTLAGYDAARVKTVQPLFESAKTAMQKREIRWGEKVAATEHAHTLRHEFETRYLPCFEYAEVAHKHTPELYIALGLNESRKKTYLRFVDQAENFLANLKSKPEFFLPLSEFSITEAHIEEMLVMLKEYITAVANQEICSGEAQMATAYRDEALKSVYAWMKRYKRVAAVALKPHPTLLTKLGLK